MVTAFVIVIAASANALADPPERVARISFLSGRTSMRVGGAADATIGWSPAALNYPVTNGDQVWTDRTGRLELETGATALDLDVLTAATVLNLDSRIVQVQLQQGRAIARVRELAADENIEIDTPAGAVTLLRPGLYRFDVTESEDATTVTVLRGDAEIAGANSVFPLHGGQRVTVAGLAAQTVAGAGPLDEFDDWVLFRDRRADDLASVRYVSRTMVGYEDLDEFGTWQMVADYGPVWVPHVRPGWAPYRFGHWAWVAPWGWTWIDDAAWGFAPFHYGRWAYVAGGWVWVPGIVVARPVYAPALVAFLGGPNWRFDLSVGAPVGWFPLGPREVFVPAYSVSPTYVAALNRPHVSAPAINVDFTAVTYVNRAVPGAVTVVSREVFQQARSVAPATLRVSPQVAGAATVIGHAVPRDIAPVGRVQTSGAAVPPSAVAARAVIVRTPPPPTVTTAQVRRVASAPAPRVQPSAASSKVVAPQPPPVAPVTRAAPNQAAAEMTARHAQERADIEARHAAERAALQAQQAEEATRTAASARQQADARAKHAREQAELDARQKREHEQLRQRQESEHRRP
jgi:hypothetical protein